MEDEIIEVLCVCGLSFEMAGFGRQALSENCFIRPQTPMLHNNLLLV